MSVVLDDDVGVLCLYSLCQCSEHCGLSDTSHILKTDFLGAGSDNLVGYSAVVLYGVDG